MKHELDARHRLIEDKTSTADSFLISGSVFSVCTSVGEDTAMANIIQK